MRYDGTHKVGKSLPFRTKRPYVILPRRPQARARVIGLGSMRNSWTLCLALASLGGCEVADCAEPLVASEGRCDPPEGTCGLCDEHEFCDTTTNPDSCVCVAGYQGDPCVFSGVIEDPGFGMQVGEGPWVNEASKGATVLNLDPGDEDPGVAFFGGSVVCNAGSLLQQVRMPPVGLADPLVAEVNYVAQGVHGLAVGFDRSWRRLRATGSDWRQARFCLGEGAYGEGLGGGPVELRLSASEKLATCNGNAPDASVRIDRFDIQPANEGECPEPGAVVNGTAEPEHGGWRFFAEPAAEAAFSEDEGRDGTPGVKLAREAGSTDRAAATIAISVPRQGVGPSALVFWWRGSSGSLFPVNLGTRAGFGDSGRRVDTLVGTGSGLNFIYCLPPWTYGSVLDLSFSLPAAGPDEPTLIVDDVRIVQDDDCGSTAELLDPSFESAPNRWPGAAVDSTLSSVLLDRSDTLARTGSGFLEFGYESPGAVSSVEAYVLVPTPGTDEGPALRFFSRSPETTNADARWALGLAETETGPVEAEEGWRQNEICLPAQWANRWFRVEVEVEASASLTGYERLLLDDFSLVNSSDCAEE